VLADAADLDALQRRITAVAPTRGVALEVFVAGDVPLSWLEPASISPAIQTWATACQRELLDKARAVERIRHRHQDSPDDLSGGPGLSANLAAIAYQQQSLMQQAARGMAGWGGLEEDTRSLAEFEVEVETWRTGLVETAHEGLPGRYARAGHGLIALEVRNLSSRLLPDVQIEVVFDFEDSSGLDREPKWVNYPTRPRELGEPRPQQDHFSPAARWSSTYSPPPGPDLSGIGRRTWVEDGSVIVKWDIGDLRQHARDTSDKVYILLVSRPPDGVLHGTWTASVPDVDGVLTGTVDVPVAERPVDVATVLNFKRSTR